MPATAPTTDPLGAEMRRVRESLGLTLVRLGEMTGIAWQTLAAYEAGRVVPPADRFLAILHATRRADAPFRVDRVARAIADDVAAERAAA